MALGAARGSLVPKEPEVLEVVGTERARAVRVEVAS